MSDKARPPGGDSQGSHKVSPATGSTPASVPRVGDAVSLDPDLWVALAVLDRVFGADQVAVTDVIPRSRP
jgi:hypothetical protein